MAGEREKTLLAQAIERVWALVPALAAGTVLLVVTSYRGVPDAARVISLGCVIFSAVAAIFVTGREVRSHAATALAIGGVVAIGQSRAGYFFAIPACIFAVVVIYAMRKARDTELRMHGRGALILLGVAAVVFGSLITALPIAGGIVERRINRWIDTPISNGDSIGFSSHMRLGSTKGMLKSDRVVLRIIGPSDGIEYLRGSVYDEYRQPFWNTTFHTTESIAAQSENPTTTIRFASSPPVTTGEDARWFLPPNACNMHTKSGRIAVNPYHVYQPDPRGDLSEISFDTKNCPPIPADAPRRRDLEFPQSIYVQVAPLLRDWTAGATTNGQRLDAITTHLQGYGYSLEVARDGRVDPVVDFLTIHKEGHCELFASSVVLLARMLKIPARVVTGYRVTERSTVFEHAVVRERNAHAWAEVFVDGSWRAVDATPIVDGPDSQGGRWERFSEMLSFGWERVTTELTLTHFIVAAVVFGVLFLLRRWWVARRAAKVRRLAPESLPLPCFVTLETALASQGHVREPSEPVELFAARIATVDRPWASAVADATLLYASFRYGGKSDERAIEQAVTAAAGMIRGT